MSLIVNTDSVCQEFNILQHSDVELVYHKFLFVHKDRLTNDLHAEPILHTLNDCEDHDRCTIDYHWVVKKNNSVFIILKKKDIPYFLVTGPKDICHDVDDFIINDLQLTKRKI